MAIWFSVLEFLKANPDEHAYFVTNNSTDFGDGTSFPYPMNEDVRGLEHRLTVMKDFDEVVSRFSTEVSGKDAEAAAAELLRSLSVRGRVAQTALEILSSPTGFIGLEAGDTTVEWSEWLAQPEVELLSVTDVTGHEIEGNVWYTANATWLLYGLAGNGAGVGARYVACVWDMKVLFSAQDEDESPTVLRTSEPSAPDTSDTSITEVLKRLKERVASFSRRAVRNLQGTGQAERLLQQQVSETLSKLDTASAPARRLAEQVASLQPDLAKISKLVAASRVDPFASVRRTLDEYTAFQRDMLNSSVRKIAQEFAANQPKLDIATLLPHTSFADIAVASLAAGAGHDTADKDEEEAEQLSFTDAEDEKTDTSPESQDDGPET
ncbi:hypothetical protein ACFY7C_37060 [Streptomyces sp. NPDC012769]|uniref:hypothetical protein n=1 Tax=Streptomyces sp. NPDC012769 TaxID=3364848 RepID=UPI00367BF7E0